MYLYDEQAIRKMGLKIPEQHKFLNYVSKPLDMIIYYDNVELLEQYLDRYRTTLPNPIAILKACIEYGASACFLHYFENPKSKQYTFQELFKKPEIPALGVQCPYFHVKNNKIMKAIDEICKTIWEDKTPIDLLTDPEQIRYCAARFGVQGRVKIAKQLLDKLPSPLFMVNNVPVFEQIYCKKSEDFCKTYLETIEKKNLVEPFLLTLFSTHDGNKNKTYLNFFDRFTKEKNNTYRYNIIHLILNDFLVRNIKNNNITLPFQELMISYCIYNGNQEDFKTFYDARPIETQSMLLTIEKPWKYSDIQNDPNGHGISLANNALKIFESAKHQMGINNWIKLLKEINCPELSSSFSSLFCFAEKGKFNTSIKMLSPYTDWHAQDENGNNFAHHVATFIGRMRETTHDLSHITDVFSILSYLIENYTDTLIKKNKNGLMAGRAFTNLIDSYNSGNNFYSDNKVDLDKIKTFLDYSTLKEELDNKEPTPKRIKI